MVWRGASPEDSLAGFWHHGIRLPDSSVIHYAGMDGPKTFRNATIQQTIVHEFSPDPARTVHIVQYATGRTFPEEQVIERAQSQLGRGGYNVAWRNCECFARWCATGRANSFQTESAVVGTLFGLATVLTGGGMLAAMMGGGVVMRVWESSRNRSADRQGVDTLDSDEDT